VVEHKGVQTMGERKPKRKQSIIRGDKQKFEAQCPNCRHSKRIEIRKHGRHRSIYGVTELTSGAGKS